MTEYIREIKCRLRDDYRFKPSRTVGNEPCFDNLPDGAYPMKIDGKLDLVLVIGGTFECCNFICEKGGVEAFQKRSIKERGSHQKNHDRHLLDELLRRNEERLDRDPRWAGHERLRNLLYEAGKEIATWDGRKAEQPK